MKNKPKQTCPECGKSVDLNKKNDGNITYCSHCGVRFLIVVVADYHIELIPLEVVL